MRTLLRALHAIPLAAVAFTGACASAIPAGEAISRLEARRAQQPNAAAVHRSLGIALYKADRLPEARASLSEAMRLDPRDGTTALYLGLTAEKQGEFAAAREAYTSYLRHGRTRRVRSQLQSRLAALQRRELEAAAKAAVANEASLGQVPGNPRVVAVMPFQFSGADSSLQPLERGLAELVTTDLARASALTVVERARMQALLDELELQRRAGDSTTAARAGRLIQAGRIVQGGILQLGPEQLRVDAAIVDVPTTQAVGGASGNDQLDAIFDLEKRLVLDLFEDMGVQLTVAERRAIEQRPTRSLAAFLSYSRGLMAEDEGNFDAASRFYNEALRLDPNFGIAAERGASASSAAEGADVTTETVEATAATGAEGQVASAAAQGTVLPTGGLSDPGTALAQAVNDLNVSQSSTATGGTTTSDANVTTPAAAPARDPASEGTGNDSPTTRSAKVIIVIPIPDLSRGGRP